MSYCVNCGVELADSEKRCPLCQVEVMNPRAPWVEPTERPYPHHLDNLMRRIDRRYFATLAGLLLIIPCVITLLLDLILGGGITWSAYPMGAAALVFIFVFLPFYFKKYHTLAFLSADCAAVLLYLLFIERMNGGHWFLRLGLPITTTASVCMILLALLFTKTGVSVLIKAGAILIAIGLFVVCAELFIDLAVYSAVKFTWSFYVLIPCVILGVMALVLEHRENMKERIRRRLFY
jgi:hypothetical protein